MKRFYKSGSQKRKEQQKKIKCQKSQANRLKAFLEKPDFSDASKGQKRQKFSVTEDSCDSQSQFSISVSPPKEKADDNTFDSHVSTFESLSEKKLNDNTSILEVSSCESISEQKQHDDIFQLQTLNWESLTKEKIDDNITEPQVSSCESLSEKQHDDIFESKVSTWDSDGILNQNSKPSNEASKCLSNEDFPTDIALWPANPSSAMIEFFIRNKPQNTGELRNMKKFFCESKKKNTLEIYRRSIFIE